MRYYNLQWQYGKGVQRPGCKCDARFTCAVCLAYWGPTR